MSNLESEIAAPPSPQKDRPAPQPTRREKKKARAKLRPWRHPQAWAPREICFYLFLAPFCFWPLVIGWFILTLYSQELADVPLEDLKNVNLPTISYIYAANGAPMAELYREHRLVLPLEQIPPMVINAFLAAEDSGFYQHQGVDFIGLVRAATANFRAGHTVQGASTITQQMIRTFLLTNERTYDRKLREMVLAWRVERTLTKDEILYLYLNRIYLGRGAYGVESAARLYFGKSITQVNLGEAAMLAGLVKAPGRLAAHLGSEKSLERQHYVIQRLLENHFITPMEAQAAINSPLSFIQFRPNLYREVAPQFTEVVRRQAIELLGEERLLTDGVKIHTTIDLQAQEMAKAALREGLDTLARRQRLSPRMARLSQNQALDYQREQRALLADRPLLPEQEIGVLVTGIETSGEQAGLQVAVGDHKGLMTAESLQWLASAKQLDQRFAVGDQVMARAMTYNPEDDTWIFLPAPPPDLQGALVLMENKTGAVRALIGGRDFDQSQFNRAVQAKRQPGSSFKPFVYTAALDHGYTEASIIYDVPTSYPQGAGQVWQPKNYSGRTSGPMTLYSAVLNSVNIPAVKVCDAVGPQVVIDYARKMGITADLTPTLSLALGASEVTLLELTRAYTTFPNLGAWAWPILIERVENRHGQLETEIKPHLTPAISPQTAYIMVDLLRGVATRGTAARVGAALKVPVAGKTGTTNEQADALFIGFTPEYTCGVWVGRDKRVTLGYGEQGGRSAAPIFVSFMSRFLADKTTGAFEVPEGVTRQQTVFDASTGQEIISADRGFVFKVGEVGPGRVDERALADLEAARRLAAPPDFSAMSQEELDRRLSDYLSDYERRRSE